MRNTNPNPGSCRIAWIQGSSFYKKQEIIE